MRGLLIVLLLCAGDAAAHAELVASTPADDAVLASPPSVIELRFNEPVRPIAVRLLDGAGKALALSQPQVAGEILRVGIPQRLEEGRYTLSYRVTSLDSHPVGGSIVFGIGTAGGPIGHADHSHESEPPDLVRIAVRAIRDLALLIAAGGALFSFFIGAFAHQRGVLLSTALIGIAAAVVSVGLQGAALLGEWHSTAWSVGLYSSFGLSACVAIAGLLAISSLQPWLMALGAIAALASLSLTGHALIAHPAWLAMVAVAGHALAAAFWIGSLAGLLFILRKQPERAAAALRRFSPAGVAAVVVLLAGGITLAVLQLHAPSDLVASGYGRVISAKASLLALLIVLALINRFRLLPALERGSAGAGAWFARSIGTEFVLITFVIAITAALVQTPPPQRAHEQTLVQGSHKLLLSVAPARAGSNVIEVRIRGAEEVSLEIANAAAKIEPIVRPMRRVASDRYRYEGSELAFPGAWDLTIHVRVGEFEKLAFPASVAIR